MPKKKKYTFYICTDCEIDFLTSKSGRYTYCPLCGENLFTEYKTTMWIERPFSYKQPWTREEDEIIRDGKQLGYSNKRIAESLDGRTAKAVNNRWCQVGGKLIENIDYCERGV